MALQKTSYLPGIILFIVSLIISFLSFKDYGISWDEPEQREIGFVSYNYVFHHEARLETYSNKDHGVAFEVPLVFIEKVLKIEDSRNIYLMRHLVTNLFFLISCFCGYILIYRLFKNNFIACLGFIMLAFHPRIYAHSFFNTKDIPFLSAFLIALTIHQIAFEKDKTLWYLLLGIACGYATSVRILGILLVVIINCFFIVDIITAIINKNKPWAKVGNLCAFFAAFCIILYATYPTLWRAPIHSFAATFTGLSNFRWSGYLLFNGEVYKSASIPWDYIPVWMSITTPIVWLLLGIAGIVWMIINFIRKPLEYITNTPKRNFILYIGCVLLPVFSVIFMHSVVYDDWRHLYFIYPSFVILGVYVVYRLYQYRTKVIISIVCLMEIVSVGYFMIRNHPYSQVYFNDLVSHKEEFIRKNYDFEYWGTSCKEALEYIAAHDTSSTILVSGYHPVKYNLLILPPKDRARIKWTEEDETSKYFITFFRDHRGDYDYPNVFYNIRVLNSTMLRVYKLH